MKTLEIINNWVSEHSVVLDLGCGKGEILSDLISSKDIKATGVEIDSFNINESIKNGINVNVPPFIESGDKIILDTRTLEYVKKVN